MKALIWFGVLFALSFLTTMLKEAGILLGAIPTVLLYSGAVAIARALCKAIDEKNQETEPKEDTNRNYTGAQAEPDWVCAKCKTVNRGRVQTCQGCGITKQWSMSKSK